MHCSTYSHEPADVVALPAPPPPLPSEKLRVQLPPDIVHGLLCGLLRAWRLAAAVIAIVANAVCANDHANDGIAAPYVAQRTRHRSAAPRSRSSVLCSRNKADIPFSRSICILAPNGTRVDGAARRRDSVSQVADAAG